MKKDENDPIQYARIKAARAKRFRKQKLRRVNALKAVHGRILAAAARAFVQPAYVVKPYQINPFGYMT